MIRVIIAGLLSAVLLHFMGTPATQINNSVSENKPQQVRTEQPRKAATATLVSQENVQTKPEAEPKPEPVHVETPAPTQGCEAYRPLIEQYDWDNRIAMAVMQAESGCNPNAHSPTADRGLMQVNAVHADMVDYDLDRLFNPNTNVSVAYRIYLSQGWHGWSTYNSGAYLRYL